MPPVNSGAPPACHDCNIEAPVWLQVLTLIVLTPLLWVMALREIVEVDVTEDVGGEDAADSRVEIHAAILKHPLTDIVNQTTRLRRS